MRVAVIVAVLAVSLGACSTPTTTAEGGPDAAKVEEPKIDTARPEGVAKELYTSYFAVLNNGGAAQTGNYVDKYFAPELAAKYAAASNSPNNPVTFDIFLNAQDHRELTLGQIKRMYESADHASYEVRFTNNGDEQKVRLLMEKTGGGWKITDIQYAKDLTLSGMLK
jgi:uncharacterized protein DUF3828